MNARGKTALTMINIEHGDNDDTCAGKDIPGREVLCAVIRLKLYRLWSVKLRVVPWLPLAWISWHTVYANWTLVRTA